MGKIAVVGGGVAGASAAIRLAQAGLYVTLFEKEKQSHHKVCGEYLSGEALPLLEELGINLKTFGAVTMSELHLHGPKYQGRCRLPFPAYGLSRKLLDEVLLEKARSQGVEVLKGVLVKSVCSESSDHLISSTRGEEIFSHVLIASGKHDSKHVALRKAKKSEYVGAKMHLRVPSKNSSSIELFLYEGGYAGLSTVESNVVNLAYVLKTNVAKNLGVDWAKHQSYLSQENCFLKKYLDVSEPLFSRPVTVANLPYGFLRKEPIPEGLFYLGDQMVCIPSLTGEGMAMALFSAHVAANALVNHQPSAEYHRLIRQAFAPQLRLAYGLHRVFQCPRLLELTFPLVSRYPAPVDRLFQQTRLRQKVFHPCS